jgi:hypothetical protein
MGLRRKRPVEDDFWPHDDVNFLPAPNSDRRLLELVGGIDNKTRSDEQLCSGHLAIAMSRIQCVWKNMIIT